MAFGACVCCHTTSDPPAVQIQQCGAHESNQVETLISDGQVFMLGEGFAEDVVEDAKLKDVGPSVLADTRSIGKLERSEARHVTWEDRDLSKRLKGSGIEDVLVSWLDREVRDQLQHIDRKLGILLEAHLAHATPRSMSQHSCTSASCTDLGLGPFQPISVVSGAGQSHTLTTMVPKSTLSSRRVLTARSSCIRNDYKALSSARWLTRLTHRSVISKRRQKVLAIQTAIQTHACNFGRRAAVWRFLEDRFSSFLAYVWSCVIPMIVFISVLLSFWQTVEGSPFHGSSVEIMQAVFEAIFAAELLCRFFVCPDRRTFWWNPLNVIDLLTCLPLAFRIVIAIMWIMGESFNTNDILSIVGMWQVLKLLKLTRRFEKFQLLLSAFAIAIEALPVLLYTLLVIALIFSGIIYAAEARSNIPSLPNAVWFVIVTMTTCGYGDITPSTLVGHLATSMLMIISLLYMAIPIGIVGNAFSEVWDARDRLLLMHRMRESFLQRGFSEAALRDIVSVFDADGNGDVSFDEFSIVLESMNIYIGEQREFLLLDSLSRDGRTIHIGDLLSGLFPRDYAEYVGSLKVPAPHGGKASQT